ncbi:hypothetical protein [Klebsiella quasipneumoniae]|uniref:hypothetical protein n=1 Tax=Klebsiella quasipneumoniae TaxID=1463165 RepID=UPI0022084547|nr:hypothetical protein [Klebsiella quasipneumoniae]BDO04236.1 hypothetical protein KAM622c_38230 [Klebsiella quasipneumoniae subsp. quasipneumoniae]
MLMSKSGLESRRGVSRQTLAEGVAKGEVVLSGTKIDVDATERQQQQHSVPKNEDSLTLFSMNIAVSTAVTGFVRFSPPRESVNPMLRNARYLMEAVSAAADELGYDVEFLEEGGIFLDTQDAEFYFQRYDLKENAEQLLLTLRRELLLQTAQMPYPLR